MNADPIRVAVIVGSTREGRFGIVPAHWIEAKLEANRDFEVEFIDLANFDLSPAFGKGADGAVDTLKTRYDACDAFVIVTPEYNHSFPASLKAAIDIAKLEWKRKPVAYVSYGGLAGGTRAVQQLKTVFAELNAVSIRDGVAFPNFWSAFDEAGRLKDSTSPDRAAAAMMQDLSWWAHALRDARRATEKMAAA